MDEQSIYGQAVEVLSRHGILIAAVVITSLGGTLGEVLLGERLLLRILWLAALMPLHFGALALALDAWRGEPTHLGRIVEFYKPQRLGSALLCTALWGLALGICGFAIFAVVMLLSSLVFLVGMLAVVLVAAALFFCLATFYIIVYPPVLTYVDQPDLSLSDAFDRGTSLISGRYKELLGQAWGVCWRTLLVAVLPLIMIGALGKDSLASTVIMAVVDAVIGGYVLTIIAGIWLKLQPQQTPPEKTDLLEEIL